MKICFITNSLDETTGGGWARYSLDLIRAVKNSRVEVVVLTSSSYKPTSAWEGCTYNIFPEYNSIIKNIFWALKNRKKINLLLNDCDLIHCLIEPYAPLVYFLFSRKPFYLTLHGTFAIRLLNLTKTKLLFKIVLRKAKKNICVSRYTLAQINKKINLNNVVVINNGVKFDQFYQVNKKSNYDGGINILSVGMLKYRKGYHLALGAIAELAKKCENLTYTIIGSQNDTHYFGQLKDLVREYHLEKIVKFFTNVKQGELINYYHNSDIFLLTPISDKGDFEGFGLVYLEAGACGLPVVGTKGSGAEDAIINNQTGFLVEPKSEDITQALLRLCEDIDLRKRLGQAGLEHTRETDWERISKEYLKIYGFYKKNG